ncbi:hypothetical protein Tco_1023854 [Tanacetum coccineum]
MGICRFAPDVTSKERVEDVYLGFAKVYKAFSSEVHAFRLGFSGWGVKSLSTYPMTVGLLEKKVIHGTSEPTMSLLKRFLFALRCDLAKYGYIRNHKKIVKNGQARTRESEEYKKKPKNQSRSQKSRASVKSWSTKVSKTQNIPL